MDDCMVKSNLWESVLSGLTVVLPGYDSGQRPQILLGMWICARPPW